MRPVPEWRRKVWSLALLSAAVAVLYLLQPGCFLRQLTGAPCPGCGMTRAALSLLRGDVPGALRLHGMVWSLPVLLLLYLYDGRLLRIRWMNRALWALLGAGFALNWARHFI